MKSSSKCEVEISITLDGEELIEPVPTCLQGAFLPSGSDVEKLVNDVILPPRYTQWVNNCTDTEKQKISDYLKQESILDRERDLGTALKWIKQEMVLMKEQDKALMKQFINLRSRILQLRGCLDFNASTSDLSFDGSSMSLDELSGSPIHFRNKHLLDPDTDTPEFRARTSSLLSPRSKQDGPIPVTRLKWKSNEYL